MEFETIFTQIKKLGHIISKRDELRDYCKLNLDHITKFLPRRILNSDGGNLLECVFNGLPDNPTSLKSKVKIVDIVLQSMRKEATSLTHCGDVVSRLCLELPRLPADDLVRWCNDSIQSIVEDCDANLIWRDVLPECLSALSSYTSVKHCGTDMSTVEYKEQCVHTLCQCRWQEKQLVQLATMFKDMQLSRNDHRQVVNKICSYMLDIPPDTLPPLVHQMLKLCKTFHVEIVLSHLNHYFGVRLYNNMEPPAHDSESTTADIDDIVPHSPAELSRCLSTCIYHITQGAAEPELIRKHIKTWPKTQLLRAPFLIDVALAMSDKGPDIRSVCLDVIRSAIEQREVDDLQRKESSWARSVLPPDVDVAGVLKVLTNESANHRQLTVLGLINLAFSLLSVPRSRASAPACWARGQLLLVRLSKQQPETAPHILTQLTDRLLTQPAHTQYAECFHLLCALSPVSVERCTQLGAILESCQPTGGEYAAAAAVLDAVHPLINFSTRTRDTLVIVCRKGLYSRDSLHRCLALSGLLSALRHVKLPRAFPSSQPGSDYSAHSYLTQLTVDLHATLQGNQVTSRVRNEALCMEVVFILRRCLVQDASVKQLLYTKIYNCVKEKPVLHEAILELLYEHLSKYLPEGEADSALLIDKCVTPTAIGAVLVEPISCLLYAVAQFLQPIQEDDLEDILCSQAADTASAHFKSRLSAMMEQLCAQDFARINVQEDPGLTDLTPESKAKALKVQQTLQCYEALVAHQIMQWNASSQNSADAVYKLFKCFSQLLEQTKAQPKLGKKGSKSTLNETRDTVKSQKSQKDKGKGPTKLGNLVKERAGPFKPLPCVWDVRMCLRVMELLYNEDVQWCSASQRNEVRSKRDFHHWALRCVQSALTENVDKRNVRTVPDIAAVLYHRCICRFQDMCNFDDQTALGCVEVFRECLSLLFSNNFSLKMETILTTITGLDVTPATGIAAILGHIHTALAQIEAESVPEERDASVKKLVGALVHTAALLLETPVIPCAETGAVVTKLEDYMRTSKQECVSLLPPLLSATCREQQEAQLLDDLLLKLTAVLGTIDEEDTSAGSNDTPNFPTIDSRSGHIVLNHICAHLNVRYKCTEHLLHRARDLTVALASAVYSNHHRIDKEIQALYKSIVAQLCQLTTWTAHAAKLRCCVGGGSDKVLTACVRLYCLLAALAKQIDPAMALLVRYERLLKLSGKKLSSVTDNLITFLEASQQQQSAVKVLRDTKLIPRLVLEAEQFSKHVILLGNKAKLDFQQYLSLGTARDFRIKGQVLEEVLAARPHEHRTDDGAINDAETEIITPVDSDSEGASSGEDKSKRKRRRVS